MTNTYSAAIEINPQWDDADRAHVRQALISKIARETQIDRDDVARRIRFEERTDLGRPMLVAVLPSPELRLIVPAEYLRE